MMSAREDKPMNLFQLGTFTLASGKQSSFKIDCDALTDADVECVASLIAQRMPPFSAVEGVPRGGLRLAAAMEQYKSVEGRLLIVDDVLTSGGSMERHRAGRLAMGAVIFARGSSPFWVTSLFSMREQPL